MFEPIHLNPTNIYLMFSKYPNVKVYPPDTILLLYRIEHTVNSLIDDPSLLEGIPCFGLEFLQPELSPKQTNRGLTILFPRNL